MNRKSLGLGNTVLKMSRVASDRVFELWNLIKTSKCHLSQSLNAMIPRSSVEVRVNRLRHMFRGRVSWRSLGLISCCLPSCP